MHHITCLVTILTVLFSNAQSRGIGSEALNKEAAGSTQRYALITKEQALEAVKSIQVPSGVTLSGAVESIKPPAKIVEQNSKGAIENHEQWGGYGGALGGWGNWGNWGGFGPWRFGYSCGGFGGWAYPLGYWDAFGAGLYGGGCGLGLSFGGLFYC